MGHYTNNAYGHKCPACGHIQRVSKRERLISGTATTPPMIVEDSGCAPDAAQEARGALLTEVSGWLSVVAPELVERLHADFSDYKPVSEGASAPASSVLADGQELERSQPSETCNDCGKVCGSAAGLSAHRRSAHPVAVTSG